MLRFETGDRGRIKTIANHWLSSQMSMISHTRNKRIHIICHSHPFPGSHFGQCNHNNKRFDPRFIPVRASRRYGCQAYYFRRERRRAAAAAAAAASLARRFPAKATATQTLSLEESVSLCFSSHPVSVLNPRAVPTEIRPQKEPKTRNKRFVGTELAR